MSNRADRYERGRRYLDDIKQQSGCVLCGSTEIEILDFHHRIPDDKSFNLSGSACAKSLETLRAEIEKCVVVCANCHRRLHAGMVELPEEDNEEEGPRSLTIRSHHGGY